MAVVSVIIPCHNSARFLEQTLASVREQTYPAVETVLVSDGIKDREDLRIFRSLGSTVTRCLEQAHLGLPAARNAGIRAATGELILPLDADDLLSPSYIAEGVAALAACPEAAFVHTDYRVFGDVRYTERLSDYNLFELLNQNTLTYAALIRKEAWERSGGYDESMVLGYEDWEFWLRLAEDDNFGCRVPKVLFHYRKHGDSLFSKAQAHHRALTAEIEAKHPRLYTRAARARIKARWAPAVCVVTDSVWRNQTIEDVDVAAMADPRKAVECSKANAFLIPAAGGKLNPDSAELCALAVWAGLDVLKLRDGSLCVSRRCLASARDIASLARGNGPGLSFELPGSWLVRWPSRLERVHRHMVNSALLSLDSWLKHPVRSLSRLIPLRAKESINRLYPAFDLSFYLKFQPQSLEIAGRMVAPLRYIAGRWSGRRRVALLTPHLGPGGAEKVLLDIAGALDRSQYEVVLIATQSHDGRWRERWEKVVDRVYDLSAVVPPGQMVAAIYSMALNWEFEAYLIQNSLAAYAAIPHIRGDAPGVKVVDLVHAVGGEWDVLRATAQVAAQIDLRVAISAAGMKHLREAGTEQEKTLLVRTGIDLDHFRPAPVRGASSPLTVLFAGRLDPVKRPAMLVDIALQLSKLRPGHEVRFLVAGDGPEYGRLQARVRRAKLETMFVFLGMVEDMRPVYAESDVVVAPSRMEGIPLVVLEAFASERPVVCSRVGALEEAVDAETGILVKTGPEENRRFAMAIHSLLEDPVRRREMGAAGRRRVARMHDRTRCRLQYQEIFGERGRARVEHLTLLVSG